MWAANAGQTHAKTLKASMHHVPPTVDGTVAGHAGARGIEHGVLAQHSAAKQGRNVLRELQGVVAACQ